MGRVKVNREGESTKEKGRRRGGRQGGRWRSPNDGDEGIASFGKF